MRIHHGRKNSRQRVSLKIPIMSGQQGDGDGRPDPKPTWEDKGGVNSQGTGGPESPR